MKNSNQYEFSIASDNCLALSASRSREQMVPLSTFSETKHDSQCTFPLQCWSTEAGHGTMHSSLTPELYVNLAVDEFIPTEDLTKPSPLVHMVFCCMAEREAVVVVRLLRVVVRANLVHPERHGLIGSVLQETAAVIRSKNETTSWRKTFYRSTRRAQ